MAKLIYHRPPFCFPSPHSPPPQQPASPVSPQLHLDLPSTGFAPQALFLPEMLFSTHFNSLILLTKALKASSSRKALILTCLDQAPLTQHPECHAPLLCELIKIALLHVFTLILSPDPLRVSVHESDFN